MGRQMKTEKRFLHPSPVEENKLMNRHLLRLLHILALLLVTLALTVTVLALLAGPQTLFTHNILATGPSTGVTAMEQELLDHINAATTSIDVALYDFNRASVRDALIAASGRGVAVRVVTDDEAYADPDYAPHFQALEAAGIGVVNDGRSSIMHNKFLVIDGTVVWTGSTNLTDRGFTYNHNNSLVFTSTLLADIYTIEFEEMFVGGLFGTAKSDNVTHTLDYNGIPLEVYFSPTDDALPEILAEVAGAAESIHFGIFFFTDASLRDALIARQQAGVAVSGVWDRLGASNTYSQDEALCAAGVPIKIEDLGGLLHHKFLILDATGDNPVVITGSMNWTGAGAGSNDENTLIIHDAAVAQAYLAAYQELYDALGPETLCETGGGGFLAYLPLVLRPVAAPTPTATPTLPPGPLPDRHANGNAGAGRGADGH